MLGGRRPQNLQISTKISSLSLVSPTATARCASPVGIGIACVTILGQLLCICTGNAIYAHNVQSTQSLMRMLGVVRADLPALMAIEHHSQAKFLARRADSSELEDFVLRYKVDGGRA